MRSHGKVSASTNVEFSGCTVVMVAHCLDMVAGFCDRVLVMGRGSIVERSPAVASDGGYMVCGASRSHLIGYMYMARSPCAFGGY